MNVPAFETHSKFLETQTERKRHLQMNQENRHIKHVNIPVRTRKEIRR
jgi:hypothetical protein